MTNTREGVSTLRTALVYMPWGSVRRPSIGLGILKECAAQHGFSADVFYLNLRFASVIGTMLYERIATDSSLCCEWLFAQLLFSGIVPGWSELESTVSGSIFKQRIEQIVGSEKDCEQVLDAIPGFIEDCLSCVDWQQYDVVGFSTTFAQNLASLLLSKRLREVYPHLSIVFGGANVDSEMGFELLRSFSWVDCVVHGEAENSFPELLRSLQSPDGQIKTLQLPGVSCRQGDTLHNGSISASAVVDMQRVPTPDYGDYFSQIEKFNVESYVQVVIPMESSRGCWWGAKHHCTFCGLNGSSMTFRKKGADRTYEELFELARRHGHIHFSMADNIMDMDFFRSLLPRIAEADTDISMFFEVKANLNKRQVAELRKGGVWSIQPGIESLCTDLLRLMNKGVTALQNIQLLKWCEEFEVFPMWNILYGFPGESASNYTDQDHLIRKLFHLTPPSGMFPIVVERFSPYHFDAARYGLIITPSQDYRFIYPPNVEFSKIAYFFEELNSDQRTGWMEQYTAAVKQAIMEWKSVHTQNGCQFYFERGPASITLFDNRPTHERDSKSVRRFTLTPLQSRIYEYCDQIQSLSSIWTMLEEVGGNTLTRQELQTLLSQFVDAHFMCSEGERYLALAVRGSKAKRQNRALWKSEASPDRQTLSNTSPVSLTVLTS